MQWLISQNQVVGEYDPVSLAADQLPSGFSIADGPEALIDAVYYDPATDAVELKPDRPSDRHYWDPSLREWMLMANPVALPNWDGLFAALRGSALWSKVFVASKANLDCNSSFTVLYGTLSSDRNVETLEWAIGAMRQSMIDTPSIGDFSSSEITEINTILEMYNFPFRL